MVHESKLTTERVLFFRRKLSAWYKERGRAFPWRKKSLNLYQRIIVEFLLQRTRAETVAAFFPNFVKRFPSWAELAKATEEELRTFLQPIGLWQRRAASLTALAKEMVRRRGRFPRNREEIEQLPGVGQYIANAIFVFCHGEPQPLLDVNMARVLERFFGPRKLVDIRSCPYLQGLATTVIQTEDAADLNWAILDLAAMICKERIPLCASCPLARECKTGKQHTTSATQLAKKRRNNSNRPWVMQIP